MVKKKNPPLNILSPKQLEHRVVLPGLWSAWCSPRLVSLLRTHQRFAGHSFDDGVKHLLGQAQQRGATVHDGFVCIILERGERKRHMSGTASTWTRGSSLLSLCDCCVQIRSATDLGGSVHSIHVFGT